MKRLKRPTEFKSGSIFQTGSSPTDSKGIDLSYSYRALGGVGSTSQSLRVQNGGKSRQPSEVQVMYRVIKELDNDFHRMQMGQCGQVQSVQRRGPKHESKPTAASNWHTFHQ